MIRGFSGEFRNMVGAPYASLRWEGGSDGRLVMLDQTLLPHEVKEIVCYDVETVFEAIRSLRIRGAPAIGIAAAYGCVLGSQGFRNEKLRDLSSHLESTIDHLAKSRPTAVNLFWALDRIRTFAKKQLRDSTLTASSLVDRLWNEAQAIHMEDREMCHAIGRHGAELLPSEGAVLTHCNTGGLATSEYGTALAMIFTAHDQGKKLRVYVDETRPLLQGARLTLWELKQKGIPATLICDNMAAHVMKTKAAKAVVVGADRITARGDTANKIGTYGLAILAKFHEVPFFVAAPSSTFDLTLIHGSEIPIEERQPEEVTNGLGRRIAPDGVDVFNPAFDVTPAELISAIITEKGVIQPVNSGTIETVLS